MLPSTAAVAEALRRQAGVISRAQALTSGMSERQIDHRLSAGVWMRLHPGVYLSSDAALTWEARAHAGVLAGGEGATLVSETAAALRGAVPKALPIQVAIPPERRRRALTGIGWRVHRLHVPDADRVSIGGLPTTTRLRTAVDLAHLLNPLKAQPVIDRMLVLDQVDLDELTAAVTASRRTGSAQARRLIVSANDRAAAESERMVRRLLRDAGLTGWVSNDRLTVGGRSRKVDLVLKRLRIGIEVKGWVFHSKGDRAASDDRRVVDLQLSGWIVIPIGWLALNTDPEGFLDQVRAAIAYRERESRAS